MYLNALLVVVFLSTVQVDTDNCITPNNEKAQCISLYDCSVLIEALSSRKKDSIDFIRQSHCGTWSSEKEPKVCCGSASNFKIEVKFAQNTTQRDNEKKPLSDKRFCGYQHTDDYFYAGNDTSIDEFPWLVIFVYKFDSDLEIQEHDHILDHGSCAGSLINARYVLTAAQCLRLRVAKAVAARLGEHNIIKKQDCQSYEGLNDCSDPIQDIGFEEVIKHPQYNRRMGLNDIALIRLNKTISFTDYVRPICLPIPGTNFSKPGEILLTTGFGRVSFESNTTIIKKKIFTQLITNEQCQREFSIIPERIRNLNDNMICTRDLQNNTAFSCEGDSGAPLMVSRRKQWHMEGFAIWGLNVCEAGFPQVYTRVSNYLSWIEESIRPW